MCSVEVCVICSILIKNSLENDDCIELFITQISKEERNVQNKMLGDTMEFDSPYFSLVTNHYRSDTVNLKSFVGKDFL